MTTIATDGRTIAADGQASANGVRMSRTVKKIVVEEGAVYALCGASAMTRPAIEWIKSGAVPDKQPKGDEMGWSMLVIKRDSALVYTSRSAYPDDVEYPLTMGSGGEIAKGAMVAGKSPESAVVIACDLDINSGGEIQVVNISEALRQAQPLKLVAGE